MSEDYDAIVYDLDGTLVRLDVNWAMARTDVAVALEQAGLETGDEDVWELVRLAYEDGHADVAEDVLAEHELEGARASSQLLLGGDVRQWGGPVAVCSLNCEAACNAALEEHNLDGYVDAVVGRDTVEGQKPDPEPLLEAIDRIDADPETTLFVGDSESDAETAEAAGVDFLTVSERIDRA